MPQPQLSRLSKREREIINILYHLGEAGVVHPNNSILLEPQRVTNRITSPGCMPFSPSGAVIKR